MQGLGCRGYLRFGRGLAPSFPRLDAEVTRAWPVSVCFPCACHHKRVSQHRNALGTTERDALARMTPPASSTLKSPAPGPSASASPAAFTVFGLGCLLFCFVFWVMGFGLRVLILGFEFWVLGFLGSWVLGFLGSWVWGLGFRVWVWFPCCDHASLFRDSFRVPGSRCREHEFRDWKNKGEKMNRRVDV